MGAQDLTHLLCCMKKISDPEDNLRGVIVAKRGPRRSSCCRLSLPESQSFVVQVLSGRQLFATFIVSYKHVNKRVRKASKVLLPLNKWTATEEIRLHTGMQLVVDFFQLGTNR